VNAVNAGLSDLASRSFKRRGEVGERRQRRLGGARLRKAPTLQQRSRRTPIDTMGEAFEMRRAMIQRWATARHGVGPSNTVRPVKHQSLRSNSQYVREPRPTKCSRFRERERSVIAVERDTKSFDD
jgi:hypothetical protein